MNYIENQELENSSISAEIIINSGFLFLKKNKLLIFLLGIYDINQQYYYQVLFS